MNSDSTRIIKAVIFDLDGTLLDTETLSDRATLEAFGDAIPLEAREKMRRNGNVLPWEIKSQILGLRGDEWIPMVIAYGREHWDILKEGEEVSGQPPPPSVDDLWQGWETNLNEFCKTVEECPGATVLVQKLAELGIPLAIATSSRAAAVAQKRLK